MSLRNGDANGLRRARGSMLTEESHEPHSQCCVYQETLD